MNETNYEMIKSCAYGAGPEELADSYGISIEEAKDFLTKNSKKIQQRKEVLQEEGYVR